MTQSGRLQKLEDGGLTPRAAVRLWIRDAHEFGSLLNYARWLSGQPDDAYPLVRLPAQVVAGVRARHKGVRDEMFRDELYQVQRDVLFLFHLHAQVNNHILRANHSWQLQSCLLSARLRVLLLRIHDADRKRIAQFQMPADLNQGRERREKTEDEQSLDAGMAEWITEKTELCAGVVETRLAERVISRRYFSGDSLIFPRSLDFLEATLGLLEGLHQLHAATARRRPPDTDDDFLRWLADDRPQPLPKPKCFDPPEFDSSKDATPEALAFADHFIQMAKTTALQQVGDRDAATLLTREWMRRPSTAG